MDPVFNSRENGCFKLEDGSEMWKSRSLAVVGLVIIKKMVGTTTEDYILLVRRGPSCPDNIGKFCIPCGYLDYDETLYDACRREIWEEAGIDVISGVFEFDDDRYQGCSMQQVNAHIQPWWIRSSPKIGRQNVACYFVFETVLLPDEDFPTTSYDHCEPGEVDQIVWMAVEDAMKWDLAFNHALVIREYYGRNKEPVDDVE